MPAIENEETSNKKKYLLYAGIGIGALVLIIAGIILYRKYKK